MPARAFVVCETQAVGTSLAVDRAFGRARQARSTWPWSERAQVGPSVAQKDGSRARGPPIRAGQHRVPQARPIGGIAVISMFEPAFASCVAEKPATACTSPSKSDAFSPYASRWGKLVTCQRTSCWYSDRDRGSPKELFFFELLSFGEKNNSICTCSR